MFQRKRLTTLTWISDSPAQVTSRSSMISSLAVCLTFIAKLLYVQFAMFSLYCSFTLHSTLLHPIWVGCVPVSPNTCKIENSDSVTEEKCEERLLTWISWNWPKFFFAQMAWIFGSTWNRFQVLIFISKTFLLHIF